MVLCAFACLKPEGFEGKYSRHSPPVSTVKTFADSEQFGVNFGHFRQLPLKLFMGCDTGARPCPLFGSFEQEFSDLAAPQTLHQIIKRAVLESPAAAAVLFAAGQVLADIRCPDQIG